jgi:phage gp46-like protein
VCVSATLLVKNVAAGGSGVDPVETQIAVIQSRSFTSTAPAYVDATSLHVERIGQSAVLALRTYAEQAPRAQATCQWVVTRALGENDAERATTQAWLRDQELKLQVDVDNAEQAVQAFDHAHSLLSLPLEQLLEVQQAELKELLLQKRHGDKALQDLIRSRSAQVAELRALQVERDHLLRSVENGRRLVSLLHEKSAEKDVEAMISPPVQVLDACAPCEAVTAKNAP